MMEPQNNDGNKKTEIAKDPEHLKDVEMESLIARHIREMGEHIHVVAKDGVVSISGIVNEFGTKRDITTMVHEIAGVHEVINNVRVARVTDGQFENYR
jgi:osmotically-inducible protein OsmY